MSISVAPLPWLIPFPGDGQGPRPHRRGRRHPHPSRDARRAAFLRFVKNRGLRMPSRSSLAEAGTRQVSGYPARVDARRSRDAAQSTPPEAEPTHGHHRCSPISSTHAHHRSEYQLLGAIVKRAIASVETLTVEEVLALLRNGVASFARQRGCSVRTAHRQLAKEGLRLSEIVRRVRLEAGLACIQTQVPLHVLSKWLGFSSPVTLRRFLRRVTGVRIKILRESGRDSAIFLHSALGFGSENASRLPSQMAPSPEVAANSRATQVVFAGAVSMSSSPAADSRSESQGRIKGRSSRLHGHQAAEHTTSASEVVRRAAQSSLAQQSTAQSGSASRPAGE